MARKISSFLILFTILLSACGGSQSVIVVTATPKKVDCDVAAYTDALKPLLEEWDDIITVANSTPRGSLPQVIPDVQDVKRRVSSFPAPDCLADAHSFLVDSLESEIEAFIAFMGQKSDSEVSRLFDLSQTKFDTYLLRLEAAKAAEAEKE